MKQLINTWLSEIAHVLGFETFSELGKSLFNLKLLAYSSNFIIVCAGISKVVADYLGLEMQVLAGFALLITLQFITGIKASIKKGNPIEDNKIIRIVTRMFLYSCILFIMNSFTKMQPMNFVVFEINIFSYLYHLSITVIIFQLLISTFSNLHVLGFEWGHLLGSAVTEKLNKLIKIQNNGTDNKV